MPHSGSLTTFSLGKAEEIETAFLSVVIVFSVEYIDELCLELLNSKGFDFGRNIVFTWSFTYVRNLGVECLNDL